MHSFPPISSFSCGPPAAILPTTETRRPVAGPSQSGPASFSADFTNAGSLTFGQQTPIADGPCTPEEMSVAQALIHLKKRAYVSVEVIEPAAHKRARTEVDMGLSRDAPGAPDAPVPSLEVSGQPALPVSPRDDSCGTKTETNVELALQKLSVEASADEEHARIEHHLEYGDFNEAKRTLSALIRLHAERQSRPDWAGVYTRLHDLSVGFEDRTAAAGCAILLAERQECSAQMMDIAIASTTAQFVELLQSRLDHIRQMPLASRQQTWNEMIDGAFECSHFVTGERLAMMANVIDTFPEADRVSASLSVLDCTEQASELSNCYALVNTLIRITPMKGRPSVANSAIDIALNPETPLDLAMTLKAICTNISRVPRSGAAALLVRMTGIISLQGRHDDLDLLYPECIELLSDINEASAHDSRTYTRPNFEGTLTKLLKAYAAFTRRGFQDREREALGHENANDTRNSRTRGHDGAHVRHGAPFAPRNT